MYRILESGLTKSLFHWVRCDHWLAPHGWISPMFPPTSAGHLDGHRSLKEPWASSRHRDHSPSWRQWYIELELFFYVLLLNKCLVMAVSQLQFECDFLWRGGEFLVIFVCLLLFSLTSVFGSKHWLTLTDRIYLYVFYLYLYNTTCTIQLNADRVTEMI